jgi:hypothetical protein
MMSSKHGGWPKHTPLFCVVHSSRSSLVYQIKLLIAMNFNIMWRTEVNKPFTRDMYNQGVKVVKPVRCESV